MGEEQCDCCRHIATSMLTGPTTGYRVQALTRREREVWLLVGVGLPISEIAQTLSITESTAKKHMSAAVRKLGASGRVDASQLAALWHQATCAVAGRIAGGENWSRRTITVTGRVAA
jgi:DNA-binding CsgD family transcriptional regulator